MKSIEELRERLNSASCREAEGRVADWLVERERHYGGVCRHVPRRTVSPHDPRAGDVIQNGGMIGGDRMADHGYAADYAEFLMPFIKRPENRIVLAEVGILKGTGLALWADLFPRGRIIGLDIDLSHTRENIPHLRERGGFVNNEPELYEYDQFVDERARVRKILGRDRIHIYIDDGFHEEQTILQSFASIHRFLAKTFVCFIEDNPHIWWRLQELYPQYTVRRRGELTIVTRSPWWLNIKRRMGLARRRVFGSR